MDDRGVAAGTITAHINDRGVVIGVAILPTFRGKGLASQAIKTFAGMFQLISPGIQLLAYIKPDNTASRRAFAKAGFLQIGTDNGLIVHRHTELQRMGVIVNTVGRS